MHVFHAKCLVVAFLVLIFAGAVTAQRQSVDPLARYHRVIALVHVQGSGKQGDEIRPEYVPAPGAAPSRSGIIAWSMQLTDDKKMAIIHAVAVDRHAFDALFADKRPEIKVFEIGAVSVTAIETALKLVRSDFSLAKFTVVAQ